LVFKRNKTLKFANIISNPVDKLINSRCKLKQRCELSSSNSSVTVNTQHSLWPVAVYSASSPDCPVNSPTHQLPVMTKGVKQRSSRFTCTIARQRQAPCPTANGQYV